MLRRDVFEIEEGLRQFPNDPGAARRSLKQLTDAYLEQPTREEQAQFLKREANHALQIISAHPALFVLAWSDWVTEAQLVELAKGLLRTSDVHYLQHGELLNFDLSIVEEGKAILAAYRLSALFATPAITLSWILALHVAFKSENGQRATKQLISHYAREFLSSSLRLLGNKATPLASSPLALQLEKELTAYDEILERNSVLPELAMTPEMRLLLSSIKTQQNREIMRESEKASLLATLFTKQHFKYSHRTAIEVHNGTNTNEVSLDMASYSVAVELPLSELTDPMMGKIARENFWGGLK